MKETVMKIFSLMLLLLISSNAYALTEQEAVRKVQNAHSVYGNTLDCVEMALTSDRVAARVDGKPDPQPLGWAAHDGKSGQIIVEFHYISGGTAREVARWILKPTKGGSWRVIPYRGYGGGFAPICTQKIN